MELFMCSVVKRAGYGEGARSHRLARCPVLRLLPLCLCVCRSSQCDPFALCPSVIIRIPLVEQLHQLNGLNQPLTLTFRYC
jgi:hypothetical protein